ncbi:MAG TPA: vitamin K epoxide reductase family protein [Solirubrobacteraceae bacterium]|jgi:uncharacterized membrane protein|nr:vitamin K epoxide reductase family protein [Solirubrobacteraceae bacterium]
MSLARVSQMSRLRLLMIVLAFIGLGVATYLTVVHYVGFQLLACSGGGKSSCATVQSSQWSTLAGIPVALLGLVGYVFILGSLLAPDRYESRTATLGFTLVGFAFSGYLTWREGHSIHAWCEWCLSSAGIMTVLFALSIARFLTAPAAGFGGGAGGGGGGGGPDDDDSDANGTPPARRGRAAVRA